MANFEIDMDQLLENELVVQARETIKNVSDHGSQDIQLAENKASYLTNEQYEEPESNQKGSAVSSTKSLREDITNDLIEILSKTLKIKNHKVYAEENLANYGVDSIMATEFINKLSRRYKITLSATILFEERNLSGLAKVLEKRFNKQIAEIYNAEASQASLENDNKNSYDGLFDVENEWLKDYKNLLRNSTGAYPYEPQISVQVNQSILVDIKSSSLISLCSTTLPRTEFVVVGQGEPLVFIPGIYANAVSFIEQIEHLKSEYKCYIYHPPGHGSSDLPDSLTSIDGVVEYLHESLLLLGVDKNINIVAWSLGASVALEFAIKHPEMLKKLILISGTASNTTISENSELDLLPDHKRSEFIRNMPDLTSNLVKKYGSIFGNWDCEENCKKIAADTLIIHGKNDSVVDVKRADVLNGLIEKSQRKILDDAGHLIPLTHPKELNVALTDFLK